MQTGLEELGVISRVERGLVWGRKDSLLGLVRDELLVSQQETGCPGSASAQPWESPPDLKGHRPPHKHILCGPQKALGKRARSEPWHSIPRLL